MYYISIPSYPSPYSTAPLVDAVGAITQATFDFLGGVARVELSIFADLASAQAGRAPVAKRSYPIPAIDPPAGSKAFGLPSLATLEKDNAATFAALVGVFYQALLADPALPGAKMLDGGSQ